MNTTFYRTPTLKALENWYVISPPQFRFAVKAPRAITHYRKFNGVYDIITRFYDLAHTGLRDKLSAILFQMHPNYRYTDTHLDSMINSLDPSFTNVVEFRHASWWNEAVFKAFSESGIVFSGVSHPALPDDVVRNSAFFYYRFHGAEDLYSSEYSTEHLLLFVKKVEQSDIRDAFVFFNNDLGAAAVRNAAELKRLISM